MINTNHIKKLEQQSKWQEALVEWKKVKKMYDGEYLEIIQDHINAVELIIKAISLGDEYRKKIQPYMEQYENHNLTKQDLYIKMTELHLEVYSRN